jgi:hypothetical protein
MSRVNGAVELLVVADGRGKRQGKRQAKPRQVKAVSRARRWITVGLGCGIPALSLALSSIGGRLVSEQHMYLGSGCLVLCCGVLAVSLSHLAWAIRDITGSARWQSWALAAAVDASLVLGELAGVAGFRLWVVPVVMVAVAVVSAALNCWAFLAHRCK